LEGGKLGPMLRELGAVAVQVLGGREVVRLEIAPVDEQELVARRRELLDGRAADEPRPAQNGNSQLSTTLT
jgi:hypothetical protein